MSPVPFLYWVLALLVADGDEVSPRGSLNRLSVKQSASSKCLSVQGVGASEQLLCCFVKKWGTYFFNLESCSWKYVYFSKDLVGNASKISACPSKLELSMNWRASFLRTVLSLGEKNRTRLLQMEMKCSLVHVKINEKKTFSSEVEANIAPKKGTGEDIYRACCDDWIISRDHCQGRPLGSCSFSEALLSISLPQ